MHCLDVVTLTVRGYGRTPMTHEFPMVKSKKGFAPLPATLECPALCVWWHFGRAYAFRPAPKPGA